MNLINLIVILFMIFQHTTGKNASTALLRSFLFGPRLIGGSETKIENYPYQVSLSYRETGHYCGGSLLKLDAVLTAAHCMYDEQDIELPFYNIVVCAGSTIINDCSNFRNISEVFIHDRYSYGDIYLNNDIALIKLSSPFKTSFSVQTIPLSFYIPRNGEMCVTSGWGSRRFRGLFARSLKRIVVPIIDPDKCKKQMANYILIDAFMLCAGFNKEGINACQGDSGGPLVCNGLLTGIVTAGTGCIFPTMPAVYTNVASYQNWITMRLSASAAEKLQPFLATIYIIYLFHKIYF